MKRYPLNIKKYSENAAKNFSYKRLIIYTIISLVLTILLAISSLNAGYKGIAFVFTAIAFVLIAGYTVLNIMAIIIKIKG